MKAAMLRAMTMPQSPENPLSYEPPILSVSELNRLVRRLLESQLPLLWVEGEVSNFTQAASGHWYFSLKDANAQVRCVMFRGRNQFSGFTPANGDHVEIRALPSLYEARGEFQLGVEAIRLAGAGRLYEAFLKLRARLETEGLFDPAKKRALPAFPRCLGIVTSPQAAALHDVLTALARRMPGLPVILYPAPVQGQGAGAQIAAAIRTAGERADCDVLLVCRGGGSLEDLWAFNDEAVARAIASSPMPVVSGIGHETDFTIADFAADIRAPTPTAAAELASPLRSDLLQTLGRQQHRLQRSIERMQNESMQRLDLMARGLVHPADRLRREGEKLSQQASRMRLAMKTMQERNQARVQWIATRLPLLSTQVAGHLHNTASLQTRLLRGLGEALTGRTHHLDRLASNLSHLNPEAVLARGYSMVLTGKGTIVRDAATLKQGETLTLRFHRGNAEAEVKSTSPD